MPAALNYFRLINKSRSPVRDNRNGAFRELTGINRRARAARRAARLREKVQSAVLTAPRFALIYNAQLRGRERPSRAGTCSTPTNKKKRNENFRDEKVGPSCVGEYREVLLNRYKVTEL